jgi:hypothetical protein
LLIATAKKVDPLIDTNILSNVVSPESSLRTEPKEKSGQRFIFCHFDERSTQFRPSLCFFSVVSGGKPAALLYGVGWEEVHLPEQVRHALYQVSTATALVEGIYEGAVQVSTLRNHGDLGLGTFEGLDGEMVIVDGHFFQVRGDGSVREVRDNVLNPFAGSDRDFCPSSDKSGLLP